MIKLKYIKAIMFMIFGSAVLFWAGGNNLFCERVYALTITAEKPSTVNGVYQIGTAEELYWFAEYVNDGNASADAVLTADITVNSGDLSQYNGTSSNSYAKWTPIGNYLSYTYSGTFDGQGHTISGLYYNNTTESTTTYNASTCYIGLFGVVDGGDISNVGVEKSYFRSSIGVGGICGYLRNNGTITDCWNESYIRANNGAGGICGLGHSTITSCRNAGTVTNLNSYGYLGGICGYCTVSITDCYNTGEVIGWPVHTPYVGGVCGYLKGGIITSCYNTGTVSDGLHLGGICGYIYNDGTITNCYNTGDISCSSSSSSATTLVLGGVCGNIYKDGTITNCYSIGDITCEHSTYKGIGGVCGYNNSDNGEITNCYYLEGAADGGIAGADSSGSAAAKTDDEFESGNVCYLLNGSSSDDPVWYQNIDNGEEIDIYPVLDCAHGVVYNIETNKYSNYETGVNPVTGISDVPETAYAGEDLTLTGTISPTDLADKEIIWNVKDAGGTGAVIKGNVLTATYAGDAVITAVIEDGIDTGTDYTQDFNIRILLGDVDYNGTVDKKDAAILLKYLCGEISLRNFIANYNINQAYVNDDDEIDLLDAVEILKIINIFES